MFSGGASLQAAGLPPDVAKEPRVVTSMLSPPDALGPLLAAVRQPLYVVVDPQSGVPGIAATDVLPTGTLVGQLPPLYPEWLGESSFLDAHEVRFPYVAGEMAGGISTTTMVIHMARAGMLAFFGAAGLSVERVQAALDELQQTLGDIPFGINLIHSPSAPALEEHLVELFLARDVKRISASAFLGLTAPVVRFACSGLWETPDGTVQRARHVFAKLSHPAVARAFLAPAPPELLHALVRAGQLSVTEARLAARVPVAEDITAEADSGGHTDGQPLVALLPLLQALRDEAMAQYRYQRPIRIGAAGGVGTPAAVAAAFALGASYVLTGSINQAAIEAGTSAAVKELLCAAQLGDVMMAPAADLFEAGGKVQVLKRGTLFGPRASRLYEVYQSHESLESIPEPLRQRLEREVFGHPLDDIWEKTRLFLTVHAPAELTRAARDPRHRMALTFRWYLGLSSRWAIQGDPGRRADYQIWCGPALGAFNAWAAGSFLADPQHRGVVQMALNLLEGAAIVTRAQQLRSLGVPVPAAAFNVRPRRLG